MTIKLPRPLLTSYSVDGERFDLYTHAQLVQAVKDALEESAQKMLDFQSGWVPDGFTECADAIRAMKEDIQ
jgi:hypothetical protein